MMFHPPPVSHVSLVPYFDLIDPIPMCCEAILFGSWQRSITNSSGNSVLEDTRDFAK
jgi:hypothetical protein